MFRSWFLFDLNLRKFSITPLNLLTTFTIFQTKKHKQPFKIYINYLLFYIFPHLRNLSFHFASYYEFIQKLYLFSNKIHPKNHWENIYKYNHLNLRTVTGFVNWRCLRRFCVTFKKWNMSFDGNRNWDKSIVKKNSTINHQCLNTKDDWCHFVLYFVIEVYDLFTL